MRLFVAINFSDEVRRTIWDAAAPLREFGLPVKWVTPDRLHLTVKFLGEVDEGRVGGIEAALLDAVDGLRAFELVLDGFGAFPSAQRPRVLWAGCVAPPPLELAHHGAERHLASAGFPLEGKPFRPHVTIGRVKQHADPHVFGVMGDRLGSDQFSAGAGVQSVDLMESVLSPGGPEYRKVFAAELGPA